VPLLARRQTNARTHNRRPVSCVIIHARCRRLAAAYPARVATHTHHMLTHTRAFACVSVRHRLSRWTTPSASSPRRRPPPRWRPCPPPWRQSRPRSSKRRGCSCCSAGGGRPRGAARVMRTRRGALDATPSKKREASAASLRFHAGWRCHAALCCTRGTLSATQRTAAGYCCVCAELQLRDSVRAPHRSRSSHA
jgi:hypothetical protein